MCNPACLDFVKQVIAPKDVKGKAVLEVGARNVNGSARSFVEAMRPRRYVGTDIVAGNGVDQLCSATALVDVFGEISFDVLISTEAMEHIEDWRAAIHNFKAVLKPGGLLILTTRSWGFPYHEYPGDFWRYEIADMQALFADCEIVTLESDPSEPGVFLKARKPVDFVEADLSAYALRSISDPPAPDDQPVAFRDPGKPPHEWGIA